MASLEEDFPRGGTTKPTQTAKPEQPRTEVDNLFQNEPEVKKKRKKPQDDDDDEEAAKKAKKTKDDALKLNATSNVNILHMKDLKVGTMMLGCIKYVNDFEMVIGLPSGLTGFMPITNISDSYTKAISDKLNSGENTEDFTALPHLFSPGGVVRCVVSSLEENKGGMTITKLSINPKEVNKALTAGSLKPGMVISGSVESIEDHGYLIDIGLTTTKAFLPKPAAKSSKEDLRVGEYLECLLEEVKNEGRLVRLSMDPAVLSEAVTETKHGWTLSNICPGLLVNATIKKVTNQGLFVEFLSSFSGTVDALHLDSDKASSYKVGDEVMARVLHVDPTNKQVALTLRSHLLPPGGSVLEHVQSERVGEVVEGCKVVAVHFHAGAIIQLPDGTQAFAHKNFCKEPKEAYNPNGLKGQESITCRITEYSALENMHLASLRKSTIEARFFSYSDIKPGQVVEGTITSLVAHGLQVKVTDYIKGLVPRIHMADVTLTNPEKKFSPGDKVKCRVLSVDVANRKLTLTRKKGLVDSSLPVFSSYAEARPGRVAHGFIVCVKDFGCIVRFYNDVKGLVPTRELSTEYVTASEQLFYVGQVMKAKVLQCDPENERLLLSFRAVVEGDTEDQEKKKKQHKDTAEKEDGSFEYEIGKAVEVRVVSKTMDGLKVAIQPSNTPAFLPTVHLSDHSSNCLLIYHALREGDTVADAVCLNKAKHVITLTKKPLLKACMEQGAAATEFSGLEVGLELTGWVKNIMPYGVFVEFPHGLYGLAPKASMSDWFVTSSAEVFVMGQTVRAKVTNLDEEKRRFLVSLKASELGGPEGEMQERLLRGLEERRTAMDMICQRDESEVLQQLSSVCVGAVLKLTVEEAREDGSCSLLSDDLPNVPITATQHHLTGVTVTSGQKVKVVVLHVDPVTPHVHVSLLPALLAKKHTLEVGSQHDALIQYSDKDFAVVSLGDMANVTVVPVTTSLNQTFIGEDHQPNPSKKLRGKVVVVEASSQALGGLPLVSREDQRHGKAQANKKRERKSSEARCNTAHSYRFGDLVTAVVSSIKPLQVGLTLPGDVSGMVHISEVKEEPEQGSFPTRSLQVGQEVQARVIGGRDVRHHNYLPISHKSFVHSQPVLSLLPSKLTAEKDVLEKELELEDLKPGQEITCYASQYLPAIKSLEVYVNAKITGTVGLLAMTTKIKDAKRPQKMTKEGETLKAKVVSVVTEPKPQLRLSLNGTHELSAGSVVMAAVHAIKPHAGLSLRLPFGGKGWASMLDLEDSYTPEPLQQFQEDQLLKCSILEAKEHKYHVSLRPSRTHPDRKLPVADVEVNSVEELKEDQILRGYISLVAEKGIFVRLSRNITGRVQFKKASEYFVKDKSIYAKHIPKDKLITVKVLSVDSEAGHVDLSALPADTGKGDLLPDSLQLPYKKYLKKKRKRKITETVAGEAGTTEEPAAKKKKKKKKPSSGEEHDSGVEVYFREEETEEAPEKPAKTKVDKPKDDKPKAKEAKSKTTTTSSSSSSATEPARLQVSAGFSWDATLSSLRPATTAAATTDLRSSDEEEEEEEEEEQPTEKKSQKRSRKAQEEESKREEEELRRQEAELMDPSQRPQSAHAFERLLLASPDSSLLWLQYMAFHLQATEIEQARAVAERALKTISFREEQEKLNVWVALMNLENMYGSEESLQKVFERAVQYCEPMPVYQRLADIYATSNKLKEAESLYNSMVKRFRAEQAVWLSYGTYLVRQGQSDAANALLQRALKSLSNKQHVDLISKFARLEFRYGDKERGKAMLEKVLSTYPKRTDLWSIFIDLMIKHGSQQDVRELLDRVIHLSVSVKKIKFFFKRYLDYEKKHGTPDTIQAVKQKALEYVETRGGAEEAS
ncbi:protein RRP5 homolog isoform X2 [Engraulis encrasicolus]|uniref:protein RRP5 homolog isoform X2 n=1 Tax=Engraulis encrasicolus TaxID=184585 RepID=UPI002FD4C4BA